MFDTDKIFDLKLDPWIPGDMMTMGLMEQEYLDQKIIDVIHDIRNNYGYYIPSSIIDEKLQEYNIDYPALPQYLKDKIDDAFECC